MCVGGGLLAFGKQSKMRADGGEVMRGSVFQRHHKEAAREPRDDGCDPGDSEGE